MSGPVPVGRADAPAPRDPRAELRKASQALEGVFLAQLLQAMRSSVPDSGLLEEDPGRDLFQSLLDERLAAAAAERMKGGVGETLFRQLERRLTPEKGQPAAAPAAPAGTARVQPDAAAHALPERARDVRAAAGARPVR